MNKWSLLAALLVVAAARAGPPRRASGSRLRIYVVGLSKSGTTSVQSMLTVLGLKVAKHLPELWRNDGNYLFPDIFEGEWDAVINSAPWSYRDVHRNYPGVQFVVAKRSAPDAWLKSAARHFCFTNWTKEDGNYDEYRTTRFTADHYADVYRDYYASWDSFAETLAYEPVVVDVERAGDRSYVEHTWSLLAAAARVPLPTDWDVGLFPFANSRSKCCFKHSFVTAKGGVFVQAGAHLDPMCRDMAGDCGLEIGSVGVAAKHRDHRRHKCGPAPPVCAGCTTCLKEYLKEEKPEVCLSKVLRPKDCRVRAKSGVVATTWCGD